MPKTLTRDSETLFYVKELQRIHEEAWILRRAFQSAVVRIPEAEEITIVDGWRYTDRLYPHSEIHGGDIVVTRIDPVPGGRTDGRVPYATAAFLNDLLRQQNLPAERAQAIARLAKISEETRWLTASEYAARFGDAHDK
jgi:hypothetical protein